MSESASNDSAEQSEFRQYCRDWLAVNTPGEPPERLPLSALEIMTTGQLDYLQAWQKSAYDAGLVGCDYPKEYGEVATRIASGLPIKRWCGLRHPCWSVNRA